MMKIASGAVAGTVLLLSLTACDDSGTTSSSEPGTTVNLSAAQVLDRSADRTAKVETFTADVTVDGAAAVKATGQFRAKPSPAFSVNVEQLSFGGMSVGTGGTRVVLLDKTVYVQNAQLSQFLGAGKPWMKITLGEAASAAGFNADELLGQFQQADPGALAKIMSDSTDVKKVGTEKIDGVETTHYQGTVDVKKAMTQYDPELRKTAEQLSNGSEKLGFDVWVDGEQLPRKVLTKVTTSEAKQFNVAVAFRDYGAPVTVAAPPADQVGDIKVP
ncbi:LppX_LprAFG lipoprotein [Actinocorallia populi]|uniref:LppX_LprAFG lipoprotein n=1 Tax=Actinocorallia populi TaxID=2079200 RepID=UPI00130023C2|nr:LppX_LprAFG lipoprotein [Actinocorallia populi]